MPEDIALSGNGSEDILREVPQSSWPQLRDLYLQEWPSGIYTFYFIDNCVRWREKEPSFAMKIYSPRGDWSDGTFIADSLMGGAANLNMDTLDPKSRRLEEALLKTRLIDWSRGHLFCGVHENLRHVLQKLIKKHSLLVKFDILSGYHWMPKRKCQKFELICPPEVYVAKLREDQVPLLNSLWPHKFPGSEEFLTQIVRLNGGLGVFLKSDHSICSWIMKNQFSGLGILQTLDEHTGKGYAKLVTKALSAQMAEDGLDIHTCIVRGNYKSQKLFKGLGFHHIEDIFWLQLDKTS